MREILVVGGGIGDERTGDRPFARIEEVIDPAELRAISERYKRVAGYDRDTLTRKEATP